MSIPVWLSGHNSVLLMYCSKQHFSNNVLFQKKIQGINVSIKSFYIQICSFTILYTTLLLTAPVSVPLMSGWMVG